MPGCEARMEFKNVWPARLREDFMVFCSATTKMRHGKTTDGPRYRHATGADLAA